MQTKILFIIIMLLTSPAQADILGAGDRPSDYAVNAYQFDPQSFMDAYANLRNQLRQVKKDLSMTDNGEVEFEAGVRRDLQSWQEFVRQRNALDHAKEIAIRHGNEDYFALDMMKRQAKNLAHDAAKLYPQIKHHLESVHWVNQRNADPASEHFVPPE